MKYFSITGGNNITGGIPTEVKNLTQLIIFNISEYGFCIILEIDYWYNSI